MQLCHAVAFPELPLPMLNGSGQVPSLFWLFGSFLRTQVLELYFFKCFDPGPCL